MKRIILSLILVCSAIIANAQNAPEENISPVKLLDIRATSGANEDAKIVREGDRIEEDERYFEGRWLWYWRQHTDESGNLVSPLKTLKEWTRYREQSKTQAKLKTTSDPSNWSFEGPTSSPGGYAGIGRINTVAFHPTNANTYWIGSAGGGAWKTTNNGSSWTAVADYLPVLGVSDIDFNPANPNTVYLCTGDRDGKDYYSVGVLKSYDGGQTWDTTGLAWNVAQMRLTNCLVINPLDTNSLILAASDGIYRSLNGGQTFVKVKNGNFKQVLYHPTDTAIVYATSFFTYDNGTDAQIFRSADGGNTWTQITNLTSCWRIQLAVTPANVSVVKAIAASRDTNFRRGLLGFYSSSDTGKSFQMIFAGHTCFTNILNHDVNGSGCDGQGNYDLALTISPTNANIVYAGGVNTWQSTDGGASWNILNQWWSFIPGLAVVHADKHFLGFHPLVPGRLFECNDGGIYYTNNPQAQLWTYISNGLGITQFYRNAVADVATYVIGGAQDNGSKIVDNNLWDDLSGGDGMECQIDYTDSNTAYTSIQYGGRIFKYANSTVFDIATSLNGIEGGWITPFTLNPGNPSEIIAGYKDVYIGDTWGQWDNLTNGTLGNKNILRLGMTPVNPGTLYVVQEDTNVIWYTHNYQFTPFSTLSTPYPEKISDIKVDPKDKDHIYVSFSGYGTNKVAEYKPVTGWNLLNTNLPNVPVNCIEIDSSNETVYIGTDVAVFFRNSTMNHWSLFNNNLPAVHVTDLGINYTTGEIWAATYGRGMWRSPKIDGILDIPLVPHVLDFLTIYPNPAKDAFSIKLSGYNSMDVECSIIDMNGRSVWQKQTRAINDEIQIKNLTLSRGIYMVNLKNKAGLIGRKKLVIR